ncbi:methionine ABC transporter permease [Alicyclobacillus acidoterrestris]|uniref:ABC transporter permease n=1 Tax=Alicyclobacillus acidoterrestris (strain ATCC 49025 / DSM 3922 / CIP 106132 / NCIMB 13137 / GD3B) TaxID=1356854 RepID=A0A9E7CXF1_ALIAG|nr:methionine ABC transporter permease [Alicyclobacillus acidoterrestris]UNO50828.1 ABC transporter permease [Alicyclobacillus acidoterrestris]
MIAISTLLSVVIGLPIGILLYMTAAGGLRPNRIVYQVTSIVVNIVRSVPFIILLIALIPFTEWIVGTSIGVNAAIVPLVISAAPFFARVAETALREVHPGVIEAAQSMGASVMMIVWRVLLRESWPSILAGVTLTAVALVGNSAMSGVIGGGGLGDLAVRYGYERFQTNVMIVTTIVLIILVQILQMTGDRVVHHFAKRRG